MLILSKINPRRYFSLSLPLTCITLLLVSSAQMLGIVVAYLATLINQWMLIYASIIWLAAKDGSEGIKHKKTKVFLCFMGKFIVLLAAMCFCMHSMEKKAIIPLANYVLHIFILFIALEKRK